MILVLLAVIAAALAVPSFRFLSETNVSATLKPIAPLDIMALGVGVLMIAGEFDLSVGAMLAWKGAILFHDGANSLRFKPSEPFATIFGGSIGVVQASMIWFLILFTVFLNNHFCALGGNRNAAVAIGINPVRTKMIVFAIAACVIGGFALMGGRGAILGTLFGTALRFIIRDVLLLAGAPGYDFDTFVVVLIVITVVMNMAIRRRS